MSASTAFNSSRASAKCSGSRASPIALDSDETDRSFRLHAALASMRSGQSESARGGLFSASKRGICERGDPHACAAEVRLSRDSGRFPVPEVGLTDFSIELRNAFAPWLRSSKWVIFFSEAAASLFAADSLRRRPSQRDWLSARSSSQTL